MPNFEPTLEAAIARLSAVQPDVYARTRNALDGAVTRLSPYLTHGILSLRDVYDAVHAKQPLDAKHKFLFELGWRAYWRHVWQHLGHRIHQSLHPGVLPEGAYQTTLPTDMLEARTGIPVIDQAVRELYATGYVHNHARMWLASYCVHLRKVHWHAGAQWMLGHLLDGDVASNHLSWQWVAGTGSSKPYLFNAENVAKFAPPEWHSPDTAIDTSYEALGILANQATALGHASTRAEFAMAPPELLTSPPSAAWSEPDRARVAGRKVWLMHPWALRTMPATQDHTTVCIGVGLHEAHAMTPWNERRWDFVTRGLQAHTALLWWGNAQQVSEALGAAQSVGWYAEPHAAVGLDALQAQWSDNSRHPGVTVHPQACLFAPVPTYCPSFSQWWRQTRIAT